MAGILSKQSVADALMGAQAGTTGGILGRLSAPQQEVRAYQPTLRERLAQLLMGDAPSQPRRDFVGGLLGTTGLGETRFGLLDMTPLGSLFGAQEAYRAGDPQAMAMALVPAYHGTTKAGAQAIRSLGFSRPSGREPAVFFTDTPNDAYEFARMRAFGDSRNAKVVKTEVDDTGFYHANARGAVYTPELMERLLAEALATGAPGVTIRGIQNFEHSVPSTTYAVFDPSRVKVKK